jgi:hypothetical protein
MRPEMMEGMFRSMDPEKMRSMMEVMMPRMMDKCFAMMDTKQRQGMLNMCREMLDNIEAKYISPEA